MGRGRQKAKQTKVARQLKYFSPETNYDDLQRELSGGVPRQPANGHPDPEPDSAADVRESAGADDDAEEYGDWSASGR